MLSTTLWIRIIWENIHCQSTYKVLSTLLWVTSLSRLIFFMNVSVFFSIVFNEDILATSGSTVNWSAYDMDSSCQLTLISTFLGGFVLQQLHLHLLILCVQCCDVLPSFFICSTWKLMYTLKNSSGLRQVNGSLADLQYFERC